MVKQINRFSIISLIFIIGLIVNINIVSGAWADNDYGRCKTITIEKENIDGSLTNFVLGINVTYDSDMQSDFDDLLFYSGTCYAPNNNLKFDLEKKVDSNYAEIFVQMNTTDGQDNYIAMYYDNPTASSNESKLDTYDDNYHAVFHMNETGTTIYDIINGYSCSKAGTGESSTQGIFDGAWHDGGGASDYMNCGSFGGGQTKLSIEIWVNPDTTYDSSKTGTGSRLFRWADAGKDWMFCHSGEPQCVSASYGFWMMTDVNIFSTTKSFNAGTWYYLSFTLDSDSNYAKIYVNGVEEADSSSYGLANLDIDNLDLGARPSSWNGYDGYFDEFRISTAVRTEQYFNTTYLTMTEDELFSSEFTQSENVTLIEFLSPTDKEMYFDNWVNTIFKFSDTGQDTIDYVLNINGVNVTSGQVANNTNVSYPYVFNFGDNIITVYNWGSTNNTNWINVTYDTTPTLSSCIINDNELYVGGNINISATYSDIEEWFLGVDSLTAYYTLNNTDDNVLRLDNSSISYYNLQRNDTFDYFNYQCYVCDTYTCVSSEIKTWNNTVDNYFNTTAVLEGSSTVITTVKFLWENSLYNFHPSIFYLSDFINRSTRSLSNYNLTAIDITNTYVTVSQLYDINENRTNISITMQPPKLALHFTNTTNGDIADTDGSTSFNGTDILLVQTDIAEGYVSVLFNENQQLFEYYNDFETHINETLEVLFNPNGTLIVSASDFSQGVVQYALCRLYRLNNTEYSLFFQGFSNKEGKIYVKIHEDDYLKITCSKSGYQVYNDYFSAEYYEGLNNYYPVKLETNDNDIFDGFWIFSNTSDVVYDIPTTVTSEFFAFEDYYICVKHYRNASLYLTDCSNDNEFSYSFNMDENYEHEIQWYVDYVRYKTFNYQYQYIDSTINAINPLEYYASNYMFLPALFIYILLLIGLGNLYPEKLQDIFMLLSTGFCFISYYFVPVMIISFIMAYATWTREHRGK